MTTSLQNGATDSLNAEWKGYGLARKMHARSLSAGPPLQEASAARFRHEIQERPSTIDQAVEVRTSLF
eukprot:5414778-Pyramimonas_sp.AAC.1